MMLFIRSPNQQSILLVGTLIFKPKVGEDSSANPKLLKPLLKEMASC